jgi:hypothetical protein
VAAGAVAAPPVAVPVAGFAGSVLTGAAFGFAALNASPPCFAQNTAIKQTAIQIEAVIIVIFVNTSPAFAPNALEPPIPPNAPARPPPRPRCTRTSRIKKIARNESNKAKKTSAMEQDAGFGLRQSRKQAISVGREAEFPSQQFAI